MPEAQLKMFHAVPLPPPASCRFEWPCDPPLPVAFVNCDAAAEPLAGGSAAAGGRGWAARKQDSGFSASAGRGVGPPARLEESSGESKSWRNRAEAERVRQWVGYHARV